MNAEPPFMSELYSAYAAGRLSPAYALLLETQAALRADIAADIAVSEAVAGAMLEGEDRALMAPNAFESALHAIDAEEGGDETEAASLAHGGEGGEDAAALDGLPAPLRGKALAAYSRTGWRRLTGGVSRLDLSENTAVRTHLYRIEPGASVPAHSHYGDEVTLVLQGGFSDHTGSYGPGEVARQTPRDTHRPVADDDGICMVLAVSEGGMRFRGLLGLIQRVVRS